MTRAVKAKVRVLLVEDHPVTRQGVRKALHADGGFDVVGEAGDGEQAVALAKELLPDVAVVDVALAKLSGVEVTRRIKAALPATTVLALTAHDEEEYVDALLEAGASGYLLKTIGEPELVQAIRATMAGECVLDPQIARKLLHRHSGKGRVAYHSPQLSQRDIRILMMIAEGLTNEDIAAQLGVSVRTAKLYISSIFGKLGTNCRTTSVVRALQRGWIHLEDLPS
jgi:DNA-binding NarL/FixJ family response regulator